jgi:glycosyltransferase involved in cell wall biosynthesis
VDSVGKRETLVIVPAFNEEESIEVVTEELLQYMPKSNILIVDDGSQDNTFRIASKLGVRCIRLPFNLGVGGAVRSGFVFAIRNGFRAAIQFDADGQHDPKYIEKLILGLAEADVVIGSRFAGVGSYRTIGPRRWAMRFLARAISLITRTKLTDVTSGFRATGPRALELFSKEYPVEYLGDTVESILMGHKSGLTFSQIPVEMRYRTTGKPSQSLVQATLFLARALLVLLLGVIRPKQSIG